MDRIRLLIASDDSSSRRGLSAIFAAEVTFIVVGSYPLDDTIEQSIQLQPDAVLLDITEGFSENPSEFEQKLKKLKSGCPYSLLIALIENEQSTYVAGIMSQGVDGFVPKNIIRGCMVQAVELSCRTGLFCLPGCYKKMVSLNAPNNIVNIDDYKICLPKNSEILTKREKEILQLMAKNNSNREIALKLFISEPTVKTHVSSILRKLGLNNRAQVIIYSYRNGLINDFQEPCLNKNS
jgi:DNA-binding NarL/FixJ family response regulator